MQTVRYDTQALYVGPYPAVGDIPSGSIKQIRRVVSSNYAIELTRENLVSLGSAYANDNITTPPFVNLGFEYLVTNGQNEEYMGFLVDGVSGALTNLHSGERDYFISISKPNETPAVIAIGNCLPMKYSVSARIGDLMRATVDMRGFNIKVDGGTSGNYRPNVDRQGLRNTTETYVLPPSETVYNDGTTSGFRENIYIGPGQIDVRFQDNAAFATLVSGQGASFLQDFSISLDLNRSELTTFGEKYPFYRCLQTPLELNLSTTFILSNHVPDDIQNYFCQDSHDVEIRIRHNDCEYDLLSEENVRMKYILRGLKLRSISSANGIGDNRAVNITWTVPIGNPTDLRRNIIISGDFNTFS